MLQAQVVTTLRLAAEKEVEVEPCYLLMLNGFMSTDSTNTPYNCDMDTLDIQ